ncbi:MAG: hypothetical protein EAZ18_24400 [Oscillatoriales cyanobacterium]|nr:MAG: hypothetical protein EAZ18_24400 [Oscillatoriales cyanobacterium]
MAQNNLAAAYANRINGSRDENIDRAIAFFDAALTVRTPEQFPEDWAMIQYNLGNAHNDRINGSRDENLEKARSFYPMSSSRIEYPRKNPVSRHPRTISETGFFPMSSSRIEYPRKNPVSRHHPQSQKPGFFRYLRLASNILAKTRFLATNQISKW